MRLEDELRCDGLHGFGAGVVFGRANAPLETITEGRDSYCASCPISQQCWFKHRAKVQIMMPKAAKEFDAMCAKEGQFAAMLSWQKRAQAANKKTRDILAPIPEMDPYTLQMVANMQDGFEFAKTGKVKERGRFTLNYPPGEKNGT